MQFCGSGMFILIADPDCSRIPDLGPAPESRIQQQNRRGGKNMLSYLFCHDKFHKTDNYFIFVQVRKIFETIYK